MALKHFADEHPLVFMKKSRLPIVICDQCDEEIHDSCYSCKECHFDLHISCAENELPRELHHPMHPKHPLILFKTPPYDDKACTCNGCNERWITFVYHCALCNFNLDIKCAFLLLKKEAEVHEHPLTLLRRSISFTCDLCGQEGKGMLYQCADCPFLVDMRCASLPRIVKHIRHKHPLNLTYSLQVDKSDNLICQLCVKMINIDYGVYFCSSCNFVELDFKLNESVDSAYIVKKFDVGGDGNKIVTEIEISSHKHDLVLTNELENKEKCYVCGRPIFTPAFGCAKCAFYLHNWCAELPKRKRHPLHKHPLILRTRNEMLYCYACRQLCNGFFYKCEEDCDFGLDVQCGSISDNLTHEGHEHPLVLSNEKGNCSACGRDEGHLFRCATCDFTLNFGCATLPHMVRYKSHEHPFILTFTTVDDGSDEYYCDICEELRDSKHCYYYCAQCDYPVHPKCILGEDPNVNFDITYKFKVHQHGLTPVRWIKDQCLCHKCGLILEDQLFCDKCGVYHRSDFGYQCTQCNIYMHHLCCLNE